MARRWTRAEREGDEWRHDMIRLCPREHHIALRLSSAPKRGKVRGVHSVEARAGGIADSPCAARLEASRKGLEYERTTTGSQLNIAVKMHALIYDYRLIS